MIAREFTWEQIADPAFGQPERQAFVAAVEQIAAKARTTLPESHDRIDRAVTLVLDGKVTLHADGSASVQGSQEGQVYTVAQGVCPCPDFSNAPNQFCKHRLSAGLARRARELTTPAETPPTSSPAPSQAAAAAQHPLPEAPASANCHLTIAGRQVQVTLRDTDETRLLARLTALLAQYPLPEPSTETPGRAEGSTALPDGWCAIHQLQMPLNEKEGRTWHSHRTAEGTWCRGKARRGA